MQFFVTIKSLWELFMLTTRNHVTSDSWCDLSGSHFSCAEPWYWMTVDIDGGNSKNGLLSITDTAVWEMRFSSSGLTWIFWRRYRVGDCPRVCFVIFFVFFDITELIGNASGVTLHKSIVKPEMVVVDPSFVSFVSFDAILEDTTADGCKETEFMVGYDWCWCDARLRFRQSWYKWWPWCCYYTIVWLGSDFQPMYQQMTIDITWVYLEVPDKVFMWDLLLGSNNAWEQFSQ